MPKVLVFGTGGVGCIYAYICEKGGASVTAVCRTNYSAVKEHGIKISSKIFGEVSSKPKTVKTISEASSNGPFDYILVCSKAFLGTSSLIKDAVTSETVIVLAQNGIGIEEEYATAYPNNPIISGVVYLPTTQVRPGIVEMGPMEHFQIGTFPASTTPERTKQASDFAQLFTNAGATCTVYSDIQLQRWIKLAVNAAWNPMTALSLCDDANLLRSSPDAGPLVAKVMREVGLVATAAGYPSAITEEEIVSQMSRLKGRLKMGGNEPSMLTDVRFGRRLESDAILGNTLRIARGLGVHTPYVEMLYTLAQGLSFSMNPDETWKPIA
jgi:2-dehydropantoate 2-reductase